MAMAQAVVGSSGAGLASASSQTSGSGRQQLKLQSAVSAGARKGRRQRRGLAVRAQNQDGGNDGSFKYVSPRIPCSVLSTSLTSLKGSYLSVFELLTRPALKGLLERRRELVRWTVPTKEILRGYMAWLLDPLCDKHSVRRTCSTQEAGRTQLHASSSGFPLAFAA